MKERLEFYLIEDYTKQNRLTVKEFCKLCKITTTYFYRLKKSQRCLFYGNRGVAQLAHILDME